MSRLSRRSLIGGAMVAGAVAMPNVVRAQTLRWRMATSWPKRLPGPGMSAERVAERVATLSGGRIQITVHAAGQIVPTLEVLDAVATGAAEMAHTASFFWQEKQPASAFFTTVPFGLTPAEHTGWIDAGGGQALWDELYAPFDAKPFMAGNTGICMGGWFRNEITDLAALKGMKIRSLGLGGEVYRRLGAVPLTTSPGEIIAGLQSGLVDGAEFVGPGSDIALGLYRLASNYYAPGFNKPNGTSECIVALRVWERLDSEQKAIIAHACAAEAAFALNEMERLNVEALAALTERHSVKLRLFPTAVIEAARGHARDVIGDIEGQSKIARRIVESYTRFREQAGRWADVSVKAVLDSRGGT